MKNILIGAIIAFVVFSILSYKTTDERSVGGLQRLEYSLPLMQKNVIVTTSSKQMLKLIKKGYVVQDVDLSVGGSENYYLHHYTLIKY